MRRIAIVLFATILFSACGRKQVVVNGPKPIKISASELEGLASYYAEPYHGRRTANGEIFDTYEALTAAHKTLPFNTMVRVTNKDNGREVEVRINDRGPFVRGRVIDLSLRAAREIDMVRSGVAPVEVKILKAGDGARLPANTKPPEESGAPAGVLYGVQVGAFESRRAAEDLKKDLERKYSSVTIQTVTGDKTLYRVRVGREKDLDKANDLASELRKEEFQPFVVRVN